MRGGFFTLTLECGSYFISPVVFEVYVLPLASVACSFLDALKGQGGCSHFCVNTSSVSHWTEGCPWPRAGWPSPSLRVVMWASTCRRQSLAQFAVSTGLPSSKSVSCVRWQAIAFADCCSLFYFLICLWSNGSFLLAYHWDLMLPQLTSRGVPVPGAESLLQ